MILDDLQARGLIHDVTARDDLAKVLTSDSIRFYAGYDPTGTSLHIGNMVPVMLQYHLQQAGHRPIVLVGGATGMVGDPSGKSAERQLLDGETLERNVAAVRAQLSRFLDFDDPKCGAILVNNADWFGKIGYLEFLRDVGKHLTVNYMTAKDSVRSRLEDRDQGISYTEFSYMLLQAYDYVVLAREHGCRLQVGGSDQWGNITAGIELARKLGHKDHLFGLVAPLMLDASGNKMGKTASGTTMWVDPERTSPYAFYQYLLNREDSEVERLLGLFSSRPVAEIAEIVAAHAEAPHKREAQRALAADVTTFVHDAEATRRAIAAGQVMFGGSLDDLSDADLRPLLADVPSSQLARTELEAGIDLVEMLARTELAKSKGAARRLLAGGGAYINNVRVNDEAYKLTTADLGTETMLILRAGKRSYHIVQVG